MIYREMPPVWDPAFRPHFYARWGTENAVISARTREVEYPDFTQLLSIKAAYGGAEEYLVDGRRIAVDDDTFLILNGNRTYGSRILSPTLVDSFSIFFAPGLLEDVVRTLTVPIDGLLSEPSGFLPSSTEFSEHLHEHDRYISPVLRYIHQHVRMGVSDELWVDEQLRFLLQRMLVLHGERRAREPTAGVTRAASRKELQKRLACAITFMHTYYREPITLLDIARAARLSPFHCLRTFRLTYGITPSVYLARKRTRVAIRILSTSRLSLTAVSELVGYGSSRTLARRLRAVGYRRPELRHEGIRYDEANGTLSVGAVYRDEGNR